MRSSGQLGVLFTSTGPGAANAVPALVEAQFAGTPMLHITGQTTTRDIDRQRGPVHDVPGQTEMLDAVCKAALPRSPETVLGTLMKAASLALTPPTGAVSVEIPIDVQRSTLARPTLLDQLRLPSAPEILPPSDLIDELADMVTEAHRPMVWAGNGAKFEEAAVARLVELGIPVITSWHGRGVIPESHPLCLGATLQLPETAALLETIDLLIVAGSRLRGHETTENTAPLPSPLAQIDIDPSANGRTYPSDLFLHGSASLQRCTLADRLEDLDVDPDLAHDVNVAKRTGRAAYLDLFRSLCGDGRRGPPGTSPRWAFCSRCDTGPFDLGTSGISGHRTARASTRSAPPSDRVSQRYWCPPWARRPPMAIPMVRRPCVSAEMADLQ